MPQEPPQPPRETPLAGALDVEIVRLDRRIAQLWQGIAATGLVLAAIAGVTVSMHLGITMAICGALLLAWFTLYSELLKRGRAGKAMQIAVPAVESAVPWLFLIVIYFTEGAAYALGSWVPPLLVACLILMGAVRLRPLAPLIAGLVGGVAFPVLYFALLRGKLSPEDSLRPLYQPGMQVTRGITLLGAGAVGMIISRALRRAIIKAEGVARQRDLFGKYRLLRGIAAGGMGTVHEALYCPEGGFERRVAVKRIHPHLALLDDFVDAFRREAELCARLIHPNVVQVLDFGSVDGSYFLAMEHIDGLTLQQLAKRLQESKTALPAKVIAHVGREILAGLAYSHRVARGGDGAILRVIHRDLSPVNILLSRHGEVKITDFGVAKVLKDAAVSETTTVAGHLGYMAPEQAEAKPFDERADLFAVGVILWELLCGRRLFHRGAPGPTLVALIVSEIVPPSSIRKDLNPDWDALVLRALERDPTKRFESATTMSAALGDLPDARDLPCPEELAKLVEMALASAPAREDLHDAPTRVAAS